MSALFNAREIEIQKSMGNYRLAGQMARLLGLDPTYGCHYGMRSTRDEAMSEFALGWVEVDEALVNGSAFQTREYLGLNEPLTAADWKLINDMLA